MGPRMQKVLVLLQAGVAPLAHRAARRIFKIMRSAAKELENIDQRALQRAISALYRSKLVACRENNDGTTTLVLTENGKRALRYSLDALSIKTPQNGMDGGAWSCLIFPRNCAKGGLLSCKNSTRLGFAPCKKRVRLPV